MARAFATATITFGLVAIPVKVYVSASSNSVSFKQINPKTGNRVNQKLVDAVSGDEVDRKTLAKGYEYAKNQVVIFEEEELKELETTTTKTVDVQEFVPDSDIDPICIQQIYFLGADKGGDKGYALLAQTLVDTKTVAVAQWSNRGKVHLVLVAPYHGGLILKQMYYADEVRDFNEVLDGVAKTKVSEAERSMAAQLVAQLGKPTYDPSAYTDVYATKVREAAAEKAAKGAITVALPSPAPVILDMFEALKKSLAASAQKEPVVEG